MNKQQITQFKEILEREEKSYSFNDYVFNYVDEEDLKEIETVEDLVEYIELINQDGDVTNAEVIYYYKAIEYLKENDPSLMESLEIAADFGFELDKLNSELLASLLMTRYNEEDWRDFLIKVEKECFDLIKEVEE